MKIRSQTIRAFRAIHGHAISACARALLLSLCLLLGFASVADAQTYVSGDISGTMTLAGSPYIASGDCSVGETLIIQPGVVLEIEPPTSLSVYGSIQADGTPDQRITLESTSDSSFWGGIIYQGIHVQGVTNSFRYCDFEDVYAAMSIAQNYQPTIGLVQIMNCTFSNCSACALDLGMCWTNQNVVVKNSVFYGPSGVCVIVVSGNCGGAGSGTAEFVNNVFENLNGTAITLYGGGLYSTAQIMNNVFINCTNGVSAQVPWDATVEDCIFVSNSVAMAVPGTLPGQLSQDVAYNDFFGNTTNFSGYPTNFGAVSTTNRNGTACDFTNNIFVDPQFVDYNGFYLQTNSPCVDAGTPDWAWTDMCFPPSLGSSFPDLGIYGGPDACNWLDVVPLLPVETIASVTNNSLWLNWGALPRSTYQVQYSTDLTQSGGWLDFTNGQVLASAKPTSLQVSPNPSTNAAFFRVQSLGRTPGN